MAMRMGTCPDCGKQIEVPEGLQEFSCLYCGSRLREADVFGIDDTVPEGLCEALLPCITTYRDALQHLMPKKYAPYYEGYLDARKETLARIDTLSSNALCKLASAVLEGIDLWSKDTKRPAAALEDAKFALCLLFVPAVRQASPWQGLRFCQTLQQQWLERYPKLPFQLTTYQDIATGFDRQKLCFITTAACTWQGKADDCAELTAFRAFRDGWLSRQADGQHLIEEYYRIAPGIVTAMNLTQPDVLYPALWKNFLTPCYEALLRGDNAGCKRLYVRMVRTLSKKYS